MSARAILFLETASGYAHDVAPEVASQAAKNLVTTLRRARRVNPRLALNSGVPLRHCSVSPNCTLGAALGGVAYREEWDFIRALADRSPISSGLEEWVEKSAGIEAATSEGPPSQALTWASLLETATVSFSARPSWQMAWVNAQLCILGEDGELRFGEQSIRNASMPAHVEEHDPWLRTLGYEALPSAADIWNEREHRFPRLRFLPRVQKDLMHLGTSGAPYKQALETLAVLNGDADAWSATGIEPQFSIKVTPEHEQRRELCLVDDDLMGAKHYFDTHARFTGGIPGRIHFRVDNEHRKFVVAYVGFKLDSPIQNA